MDDVEFMSGIEAELKKFKRDILFCWFVLCVANVFAISGVLFVFFRK